ncbi:MAG: hypothetical protein ABI610_01790 [Acidobacteriota bacterium]
MSRTQVTKPPGGASPGPRPARYVADVVKSLHAAPENLRGVRIVRQAPVLRHFTAQFEIV